MSTIAEKTEHTPGPWEFFTDGSPIRGLQKKYLKSSTTNQGFAHTVGLHEPTDTANARLIAAAPDLLAELEHVHDMLRHYIKSGYLPHMSAEEAEQVVRNPDSALLKARGQ